MNRQAFESPYCTVEMLNGDRIKMVKSILLVRVYGLRIPRGGNECIVFIAELGNAPMCWLWKLSQ